MVFDNMRTVTCLALALGSLVIGTTQDAPAQSASDTRLQFIAPGDNEFQDEAMGCGIRLGFAYVIDNVEGSRSGRVEKVADGIAVTTFEGAADGSIGKGRKQAFARTITKTSDACSVELKALGAPEPYKKGRLVNLWDEPDFSPVDVLAQSHKFQYAFSLPSEFTSEAVLANFDRLADAGCAKGDYSTRLGFDFRSSESDAVYCLEVGEKTQPVRVDCAPYRNGSKCSFFAILQSTQEGSVIQAMKGAKSLRGAVTKILND